MRRPSHVVEDLASYLGSVAGKCHTISMSEDFGDLCDAIPLYYLKDIALVNADFFLSNLAKGIEYLVAKPLCFAEKLVTRKPSPPAWTFS